MAALKSNRRTSAGPRLDKRRRPLFCPESLARGSKPMKATKASALRNGTRSNVLVRLSPTNGPTPEARAAAFGGDLKAMDEPQIMSRLINWALTDLMLEHLGLTDEAARVMRAIEHATAAGDVTADLGGTLSTTEAGAAIVRALETMRPS